MRSALGVSAGSDVVCAALVNTAVNGAQSTEYRMLSADDQANTDLGDLVASAIELMTTQVPSQTVQPDGIAVAYRSKEQTQAIRSAVGSRRRDLQLVPETAAALTYFRNTGEVAQYETVAIVDVGATGTTVSVLDQVDGTVLDSQRTTEFGGNGIDEIVHQHLSNVYQQRGVRAQRSQLIARARAAKEHLSEHETVVLDTVAGTPVELDRTGFDSLIADQLARATTFVGQVFDHAPRRPQLVAVIGGGANVPAVRTALADAVQLPVLVVDEPDAVLAKGAALLADSTQPLHYPVVSMAAEQPVSTFTKVAGMLIGAFVVVGLIIGYGVQALHPSDNDPGAVSPAGTSALQLPVQSSATTTTVAPTAPARAEPTTSDPAGDYPPTAVPPNGDDRFPLPATFPTTVGNRPSTPNSTSVRPTTPTLRPGPNLPTIPWPDVQQWLPGGTTTPSVPDQTGFEAPPTSDGQESNPTTENPPQRVEAPSTTSVPPPPAPAPAPVRPNTGSAGS